jgi:hypothetical protein
MTSQYAAWIVKPSDVEKQLPPFIMDALLNATRALSHIDMAAPETLAVFDHLTAQATEESRSILDIAVEENLQIPPPLAALLVANLLTGWYDHGQSVFQKFAIWLRLGWPEAVSSEGGLEAKLLDHILEGAEGLAVLSEVGTFAPNPTWCVASEFYELARELEGADFPEDALACAQTAVNFAQMLGPDRAEPFSIYALSLARRTATEDIIAGTSAHHAHLLAQIARMDPGRRLDAFDALEIALRRLPSDPAIRQTHASVLESWLHLEDYLKPLQPMLWLALPSQERRELPLDPQDLAAALHPIWEGTSQEWLARIDYLRVLSIEIENARLALSPPSTEHEAKTDWATWTVEHPNLRRAVPHNQSIRREQYFHELLLVLNHEITHVYSIFGSMGTALLAMRWALFELEITLWSLVLKDQGAYDPRVIIEMRSPAPLEGPNVVALAEAEQAIEVERKIQILEDSWAPWFEGIAAFGELAADPTMDPEADSPVVSAIYNLWDRHMEQVAEASYLSLAEAFRQEHSAAETLYSKAIQHEGRRRLHRYLYRYPEQYLAGYLAVRSIVAAWRATLGKPISGAEAFRILLHVTRYSGFEALPDLGLPLDSFHQAVLSGQIEWLHRLTAIGQGDLERMLSMVGTIANADKGARWVRGHLEEVVHTEALDQETTQRAVALASQCLTSLRGERAPLDRVADANEACQLVMQVAAESLVLLRAEPRFFTPDRVAGLSSRLIILPLGQASCPFWLLAQDRILACLIRTRERDIESGEPSYDLLLFSLEQEQFSTLHEKVRQGGGGRMVVTRVVDLAPPGEGRGLGRNLLVFQYEDWLYIQPRGFFFGTTEVEPSLQDNIRDRLMPNPLIAAQEYLTSSEQPCAQRTKQWIEAHPWTVDVEDMEVDISAWARRVKDVAEAVLTRGHQDVLRASSRQLLHFVTGNAEAAAQLADQGIGPLADDAQINLTELIRILDASARSPLQDNPDIEALSRHLEEKVTALLERTPMGWDVVRPSEFR